MGSTEPGKLLKIRSVFFSLFEHQKTAEHCAAVALKAEELAERFDSYPAKAEQAGYLHDISAVIPNEKRIEFACSQMVEVLAEEMQCSIFFDYVQ